MSTARGAERSPLLFPAPASGCLVSAAAEGCAENPGGALLPPAFADDADEEEDADAEEEEEEEEEDEEDEDEAG